MSYTSDFIADRIKFIIELQAKVNELSAALLSVGKHKAKKYKVGELAVALRQASAYEACERKKFEDMIYTLYTEMYEKFTLKKITCKCNQCKINKFAAVLDKVEQSQAEKREADVLDFKALTAMLMNTL